MMSEMDREMIEREDDETRLTDLMDIADGQPILVSLRERDGLMGLGSAE